MTRARAVEILKSTLAYDSDFAEAKQMAIEALEQEPTAEYSSDVISRQAAIDALYDKGSSMTAWGELLAMKWSDIQTCIELLPSAQPFTSEQIQTMQELESAQVKKAYELGKADRPKGYWIDTQVDSVGIAHRCICSICGEEPAAWSSINKFDFCPNCGADMRERGEG